MEHPGDTVKVLNLRLDEALHRQLTAEARRSVGGPQDYGRSLVAQAADVQLGATDVVLEFRDAAPIRGKVLREDGSAPPPGLVVQARRAGEAAAATWTIFCPVGHDGSFAFDNATAGAWSHGVRDIVPGLNPDARWVELSFVPAGGGWTPPDPRVRVVELRRADGSVRVRYDA